MQVELAELLILGGAIAFLLLLVLVIRKMVRGEIHAPEPRPSVEAGEAEAERLLEAEALGEIEPEEAPTTTPEVASEPAPLSLEQGLVKSRRGFMTKVNQLLFGGRALDADLVDELEEILVTSDIGIQTTQRLLGDLREALTRKELDSPEAVRAKLRARVLELLDLDVPPLPTRDSPSVIMVIGVNGVGKTTTIGKLAARLSREGKKVVLAAGDTFRAAAVEQLEIWADRCGCEIVKGPENSDPASVIYEAVQTARTQGADVCIADTAGRLHTKVNLMEELKKVHRVIGKAHEGAPHEVMLVLDATTGQNAINQAKQFQQAVPVTSLTLTKLDGTAKGGVVVAICDQLQIPVRLIGIGEGIDDLRDFQAEEFVDALFAAVDDASEAA